MARQKQHQFGILPLEIRKIALIVTQRQDLQLLSVGEVGHKIIEEWTADQAKKHKVQVELEKIEKNAHYRISSRVENSQAHSIFEKNMEVFA